MRSRSPVVVALVLAAVGCLARAGEEELEVNFQTGRRAIEPDPLVLPQWRAEDRTGFATGQPVNLGGGLWPEEAYPLVPPAAGPPVPDSAEAEAAEFLRTVDLSQLAKGPWPVASAARPDAAHLLRAGSRGRISFWHPLLRGAQLLLCGAALWRLWIAWRRAHRPLVFRFPETERPARLGGPHCGGSGAVRRW